MERLDPTVEHLGEPGNLRHVSHGYAGLSKELRRPPGRDDFDPERSEGLSEGDEVVSE